MELLSWTNPRRPWFLSLLNSWWSNQARVGSPYLQERRSRRTLFLQTGFFVDLILHHLQALYMILIQQRLQGRTPCFLVEDKFGR